MRTHRKNTILTKSKHNTIVVHYYYSYYYYTSSTTSQRQQWRLLPRFVPSLVLAQKLGHPSPASGPPRDTRLPSCRASWKSWSPPPKTFPTARALPATSPCRKISTKRLRQSKLTSALSMSWSGTPETGSGRCVFFSVAFVVFVCVFPISFLLVVCLRCV